MVEAVVFRPPPAPEEAELEVIADLVVRRAAQDLAAAVEAGPVISVPKELVAVAELASTVKALVAPPGRQVASVVREVREVLMVDLRLLDLVEPMVAAVDHDLMMVLQAVGPMELMAP